MPGIWDKILVSNIFSGGLEKLQERLNVAELQKKYNAYERQVLYIEIHNVNTAVILQVGDGKIERRFLKPDEVIEADAKIFFRTLRCFLDVLEGKITIDDIFAWEGCVVDDDGHIVREIRWDGDWFRGSIMLKDIMDEYLKDIRDILFNEKKITHYAIEGYAALKQPFADKWNVYDDDDSDKGSEENSDIQKT
ncbi:MAG: hypothetical protein MUP55_02715 [Candidatus Aenigmarchaeota archaeon]|nr:hypothetical protein [Candidatus Aenigmarchaeota archaeon]